MKKRIYFVENVKKPLDWNDIEWFLIAKNKVTRKEARTSLTSNALTDKNIFDGIVSQTRQVIENL